MISGLLVRASALGSLALAAPLSCSSHVDVGFASEGVVPSTLDGGDASRSIADNPGDDASARAAACTFMRVCNDAGSDCHLQQIFAAWCTEVCRNSIDVCDNECVDLSSDPKNCGRCGHDCSPTEECVMSDCRR